MSLLRVPAALTVPFLPLDEVGQLIYVSRFIVDNHTAVEGLGLR